jgi:dipeptidyl aminopeptidase/acylaminoacyl peptidase
VPLIHGDDDRNVPFRQTTDLVEKLRRVFTNRKVDPRFQKT